MLAIVRACALVGLDGCIIEVQTDFNPRAQMPSFVIVGLPDNAVRESRERVRAAIKNSNLTFPNKTHQSGFFVPARTLYRSFVDLCLKVLLVFPCQRLC